MKGQLCARKRQRDLVSGKPSPPNLNGGAAISDIHADGAQNRRMFGDAQMKRLCRRRKLCIHTCRGAREIRHAQLRQKPLSQTGYCADDPAGRAIGRQERRCEKRQWAGFHQRQSLKDMNIYTAFKLQGFGLGCMCSAGLQQKNLFGGAAARVGQVLVKPNAAPDGIVGGRRRDKNARAAPRMHDPFNCQSRQSLSHSVSVHTKPRSKNGLGRQLVTLAINAPRPRRCARTWLWLSRSGCGGHVIKTSHLGGLAESGRFGIICIVV